MFLATDRASYTYNRRTGVEPVPAVREISVQIARGSLTGLIGPNGCGKTTLLKLLAGVLAPDSGTVMLDGRALTDADIESPREPVTGLPGYFAERQRCRHTTEDLPCLGGSVGRPSRRSSSRY